MAANGGSILLVQIENEYGSYPRRDHDYIVWLRDQWVKEDIKGPFITADGADEHYLKGVTIPGAAVGLDSGENEAQFALARKMNPGVPVMSSETYPGWLRHWGESTAAPTSDFTPEPTAMKTTSPVTTMPHRSTNKGARRQPTMPIGDNWRPTFLRVNACPTSRL